MSNPQYHDRELSWLAFNARVLQEAADERNPLFERIRFLGIFSSNLDEFFRVRVASLRSLLRLKKKKVRRLSLDPQKLLRAIHAEVGEQQRRFGEVFEHQLLPALREHGIEFSFGDDLTAEEKEFVDGYFRDAVRPKLEPVVLETGGHATFLDNRGIYLVTELWPAGDRALVFAEPPRFGLVSLNAEGLPRFVRIDSGSGPVRVMFLDDVVRRNLASLFPGYDSGEAFAVKMTRDAELYVDDEFSGDLVEMIRKSLRKRDSGVPTRFLYDLRMPYPMLTALKDAFGLADEDLVNGGRYHNFSDFFTFPDFDRPGVTSPPMPPVGHPGLSAADSVIDVVRERDILLQFPYHAFEPVLRLFDEAADDERVREICVTLYRVASDSRIVQALVRAARRGASVTAFVEVKARFDEEPNLRWAEEMEAAGVNVLYSMPGLKVHCKLASFVIRDGETERCVTYLSTGNFNEKTARLYTDFGLITSDPVIARDAKAVFAYLSGEKERVKPEALVVAPFSLRRTFNRLIDREIRNAEAGKEAWILAKMNSLEDKRMIDRLYKASAAGVRIRLIVRGICCLVPGVEGLSENIRVTSILDRFLEHARAFVFCNDGDTALYIASSDWMTRNLSRRVEVACPIRDPGLRRQIEDVLLIQCADNRKARELDAGLQNTRVPAGASSRRSQTETYRYVVGLASAMPQPGGRALTWEDIRGAGQDVPGDGPGGNGGEGSGPVRERPGSGVEHGAEAGEPGADRPNPVSTEIPA